MKEAYVPIRPGITEHLLRGDVSAFEFGVYVLIHLQADYGTGIWRGSAPRILNSAPRGAKLREVQRALEHLTELGLLRHFHVHGQRGNFPFLINKFTVRSGALKGMRLNADKSDSWQHPIYEPCADDDAHVRAQDAPIQEVRSKKEEERKKPAAKTTPPDPRHSPAFGYCYQAFRSTYARVPTWGKREGRRLAEFLKEHPAVTAEEIVRRYSNLLHSTTPFHAEKHGSLFHLLNSFDTFLEGPILANSTRGKPNGKISADQRTHENLIAAGLKADTVN